ncbi:S-adenosyl-L-methionine-dependent methyltransferase, partial [Circinella umbellata]
FLKKTMAPALHPTAASGFDKQADAYAALDQIQTLVPDLNASICDLAAGTGILTQLLVEDCGYKNVTAVEPVNAMREKLSSILPEVTTKKGTSWEIPLPSESQDVVIVAQAWHWFADLQSLREIYRILKPNGHFILIWNLESPRSRWVQGLRNIYERYESSAPQYRLGLWKQVFEDKEAAKLFKLPLNHIQFEYDFLVAKENIFRRVMTKSYISILTDEERANVTKEMEAILADPTSEFSVDEHNQALYPHDTDLFWTQKRN